MARVLGDFVGGVDDLDLFASSLANAYFALFSFTHLVHSAAPSAIPLAPHGLVENPFCPSAIGGCGQRSGMEEKKQKLRANVISQTRSAGSAMLRWVGRLALGLAQFTGVVFGEGTKEKGRTEVLPGKRG